MVAAGKFTKARASTVLRSIRTLGLPLSLHVLADGKPAVDFTLRSGLRVDGRPLTAERFGPVRERIERGKQDDRKAATDNLLTAVTGALRDGTLEQLLLWEPAPRPSGPPRSSASCAWWPGRRTGSGCNARRPRSCALAVLNRGAVPARPAGRGRRG